MTFTCVSSWGDINWLVQAGHWVAFLIHSPSSSYYHELVRNNGGFEVSQSRSVLVQINLEPHLARRGLLLGLTVIAIAAGIALKVIRNGRFTFTIVRCAARQRHHGVGRPTTIAIPNVTLRVIDIWYDIMEELEYMGLFGIHDSYLPTAQQVVSFIVGSLYYAVVLIARTFCSIGIQIYGFGAAELVSVDSSLG
ncbi:hypothetical protein B0J17DRAFT_703172 [Rhizoctonia solani]|nr:hypothetical protein B0J17DRAFT_703172 [Rhizoctonia solani]